MRVMSLRWLDRTGPALLAIAALLAPSGEAHAQAVATPFTANGVVLATPSSQVTWTVDLATLPLRPRLIAEATPDGAHADMQLELRISNCTLQHPVGDPEDPFFCPSPTSTPNAGFQDVSYDTWLCEYDATPPIYQGETCQVTLRALSFGAAGAPATVNVAIRGETIVPTAIHETEITATAQTVAIAPTKDTTLYQASPTSSNGQGESFWSTAATASNALHGLMAFDVASNVPAGATILDARIELQVLAASGATPAFRLFPVPRNPSVAWVEGSANAAGDESAAPAAVSNAATWTHRQWLSTTPLGAWTTAGGDMGPTSLRNLSVTQTGLIVIQSANLLQHVQALHTDTTTWDGLLLFPLSGAMRFASDEHATAAFRPRLHVDYYVPATSPDGDELETGTGPYFDEGQNFRWLYDLDNDRKLDTSLSGQCEWIPQVNPNLSPQPYTYTFRGSPSFRGTDCCTWQIGSVLGVTGAGQGLFYVNVEKTDPAYQLPDVDQDGIKDRCDNCPSVPNGPLFGTCASGPNTGSTCRSSQACGGFLCNLSQEDTDRNGIGDACVPEPGLGSMLATGAAALAALRRRRTGPTDRTH